MKLKKRTGIYEASNVSFDPKTRTALSYDWWAFVRVIKGQVVFNRYFYSPSTSKHQRKVRTLLDTLGIKIDREVSLRCSLHTIDSLRDLNTAQREQDLQNAADAEEKRIERNERARAKRLALKLRDTNFESTLTLA